MKNSPSILPQLGIEPTTSCIPCFIVNKEYQALTPLAHGGCTKTISHFFLIHMKGVTRNICKMDILQMREPKLETCIFAITNCRPPSPLNILKYTKYRNFKEKIQEIDRNSVANIGVLQEFCGNFGGLQTGFIQKMKQIPGNFQK